LKRHSAAGVSANTMRRTLNISRQESPASFAFPETLHRWPNYPGLRRSGLFAGSQSAARVPGPADHVAGRTDSPGRTRCPAAHTATSIASGRRSRTGELIGPYSRMAIRMMIGIGMPMAQSSMDRISISFSEYQILNGFNRSGYRAAGRRRWRHSRRRMPRSEAPETSTAKGAPPPCAPCRRPAGPAFPYPAFAPVRR
jgi:hypothetical protein